MALAQRLPPAWYARVLTAAGPVDHEFLLALLDTGYAARVREALRAMPPMPPSLAKVVLAEAMAAGDGRGGACAA
jgi:hypothetical protein